MPIRTVVWSEFHHERFNEKSAAIYPQGMHSVIADGLREDPSIEVSIATQDEPEHGLSAERLAETDVLIWWAHLKQAEVDDAVVDLVVQRVWEGMGLIVLHSAFLSKVFKRLMGAPCGVRWRDADERERIWVVNPRHPIADGLPEFFEYAREEMYGEPFIVPEPLETVFISWFEGGEVCRSGMTWRRGAGNIFFYRPGHETVPTFLQPVTAQVLRNAVRWAHNPQPKLDRPGMPRNIKEPLEAIVPKG